MTMKITKAEKMSPTLETFCEGLDASVDGRGWNANHQAAMERIDASLKAPAGAWGKLHDIVSDLVENGKISKADIPDDYDALVLALLNSLNALDKAGVES